jgi:hypothetical protein
MEINNKQEYINTLIDNFNKYDYYTNDQSTILSLQKLKNVKTNEDLSSCLKELHSKTDSYDLIIFSDFSYNVVKRGQTNHDLWDVSIALEEV